MNKYKSIISIAIATVVFSGCSSMQKDNNQIVDEVYPIENITEEQISESETNLLESSGTEVASDELITEYKKVDIVTRIHFDFDSYEIKNDDKNILKEHAKLLTKHNNIGVILEGHTDKIGDKSYNIVLGEKRANSVLNFLKNHGVNENQIKIVSYGEERPIMLGDSEEINEKNRRVEIKYK